VRGESAKRELERGAPIGRVPGKRADWGNCQKGGCVGWGVGGGGGGGGGGRNWPVR